MTVVESKLMKKVKFPWIRNKGSRSTQRTLIERLAELSAELRKQEEKGF